MQLILSLPQPFHTITLDFILGLLTSAEDYNTVMSVTDKFSKAVSFISEKTIWGGKEWAVQLLIRLDLLKWGLLNVIILNCNVKFVTDLWRAIFKHLHVDLFYSTAYHSQTDSASKVTNQQAEIALHYYLMIMNNLADWLKVLSQLQAASNNTYWTLTCQTLNKVLYGFQLSEVLNLLQINIFTIQAEATESEHDSTTTVEAYSTDKECITEWARLWEAQKRDLLLTMTSYWLSHIDIKDTIAWAVMQVKHYYDVNHHLWFFAIRDKVLLQLHCEYKLSDITNRKLKQQFIRLFKITEQIEWLVYCLDLSSA